MVKANLAPTSDVCGEDMRFMTDASNVMLNKKGHMAKGERKLRALILSDKKT